MYFFAPAFDHDSIVGYRCNQADFVSSLFVAWGSFNGDAKMKNQISIMADKFFSFFFYFFLPAIAHVKISGFNFQIHISSTS